MIEKLIVLEDIDPVIFYGVNNANMQLIKALYPKLRIVARGNVIKVLGDEEEMCAFEENIIKLEKHCAEYNSLKEEAIIDIIKGNAPQAEKSGNVIVFSVTGKPIIPRSENGRIGQDLHRHRPGRACPEEQGNQENHPQPPRRGSRRKARLPARRHERQNRPVPATALRRLAGHDTRRQAEGIYGAEHYPDSSVSLHARTYTERCRRHPRRSSEHYDCPNQDVPHPHGHEYQNDCNGRHDAD